MTRAPTVVIGFSGEATIRQANEVAERLRRALDSSDSIEVDSSGLTSVDITFIQLILSAWKSAEARGKRLTINRPLSEALSGTLKICGTRVGPGSLFWQEGV